MIHNSQAAEIFQGFLKRGKNRITPERFEILDAVIEFEGHFSADELYVYMKNNNSLVSRATVYNTLEKLTECQLVSIRNFGDNLKKYESNFKKQNHDHIICLDCGRIIEIFDNNLQAMPEKICAEYGLEPVSYSFNIFSRCKNYKNCPYFHG